MISFGFAFIVRMCFHVGVSLCMHFCLNLEISFVCWMCFGCFCCLIVSILFGFRLLRVWIGFESVFIFGQFENRNKESKVI